MSLMRNHKEVGSLEPSTLKIERALLVDGPLCNIRVYLMMEYRDFRPRYQFGIMSKDLVRILGEYCNENPNDRMVYSIYLVLTKIVYGL